MMSLGNILIKWARKASIIPRSFGLINYGSSTGCERRRKRQPKTKQFLRKLSRKPFPSQPQWTQQQLLLVSLQVSNLALERGQPKHRLRNLRRKSSIRLKQQSQLHLLQKPQRQHPQQQHRASLRASNLASRLGVNQLRTPPHPKTQLLLPQSKLHLPPKRQRQHPQQPLRASLQVSNLDSRLGLQKRQIPMSRKKPLLLRPQRRRNLLRKPQHHLPQQHRASRQVSSLALKPE